MISVTRFAMSLGAFISLAALALGCDKKDAAPTDPAAAPSAAAAPAAGPVTLQGSGELKGVVIDEDLLKPGEGEVLSDLIIAAHADAKRKLDAVQADTMKEIAGPLAGMPGFPKF